LATSLPAHSNAEEKEALEATALRSMTLPVRGTAALMVAAVIVAATLIWLPAYRLFFALSIGIGVLVAFGLYVWRRLRPVRDEDVENKRPLGLS
jgi:hypothetical protein